MEEEALVLTLFSSFSSVFREAGTPVDVNYVVEMMRNAVVSRGLTKTTCIRLVDAIQTLSKFGVGILTVEELENQLRVRGPRGEAQDAAAKVRVICSCFYCCLGSCILQGLSSFCTVPCASRSVPMQKS